MTDRLPPHDVAMEKAVLGCVIQQPDIADACVSRFKAGADIFFDLRNQVIYDALISMRLAGDPIDSVTLYSGLSKAGQLEKIGGLPYLTECEAAAVSPANFEFYADKVSEAYMLRRALATCVDAAGSVYENRETADEIITGIETKLATLRDLRGTEEIVTPPKAANLLSLHLEERFNLAGRRSGIETGLERLDEISDGLQFGELSIIGARPSQGKTAMATSIVDHACLGRGLPTMFVTLEMSVAALCRRLCSRHCRIGMRELKSGKYTESMFGQITSFNSLLAGSHLCFLDSVGGTNINRIAAAVKRAVKSSGVRLVVVDYLQKIHASGKHEKRTYEVGEVSTILKAIAVEHNIAVLALAQLSREPDKLKGRLPQISDLADSAQIERDADLIALLHRDKSTNHGRDALLLIAKQRDGEVGGCELHFAAEYASFENRQAEQS